MAIFSRRVLQRMLASNRNIADEESLKRHVRHLNRCDEESIAVEWEVAVLYGLSQLGQVQHEIQRETTAKLDVQFANDVVAFEGDIVTVTDFGIEQANPLRPFQAELARRARKVGLSLAGFELEVGGRYEGETYDQKTYLAIPERSRFGDVFDESFGAFLRSVKRDPAVPHSFTRKDERYHVVIQYTPGGTSFGGHFPGFSVPLSITRNPLFHALDRKAAHLKRAAASGTTVIIACDGASVSMRRRIGGSYGSYSAEQIVQRFFDDHYVTAVAMLRVERKMTQTFGMGSAYRRTDIYVHPKAPARVASGLREQFTRLADLIPRPESDVQNAINRLRSRSRRFGRSHSGGYTMNVNFIRMSARAVQELLAGTLPQEQFLAEHKFVAGPSVRTTFNPFALALKEGRTIERVEFERSESDDDDWITFHFSERDAAISPFRL